MSLFNILAIYLIGVYCLIEIEFISLFLFCLLIKLTPHRTFISNTISFLFYVVVFKIDKSVRPEFLASNPRMNLVIYVLIICF